MAPLHPFDGPLIVKKEWCHLEMLAWQSCVRPEFGVKGNYYFVINLHMEAM